MDRGNMKNSRQALTQNQDQNRNSGAVRWQSYPLHYTTLLSTWTLISYSFIFNNHFILARIIDPRNTEGMAGIHTGWDAYP